MSEFYHDSLEWDICKFFCMLNNVEGKLLSNLFAMFLSVDSIQLLL